MNEQIQALLLQHTGAATGSFPPSSRYHRTPTATRMADDGREVVYLQRRLVPPPERFATLQEHVVTEGERPDHLAARYLGDPEMYWRLCDANGVVRPGELVEPVGRRVRITLPENVPDAGSGQNG